MKRKKINFKLLFCGAIFLSLLFLALPLSFHSVRGKQQPSNTLLTAANYPSLNFSSFFGGANVDFGYDVAIGSDGSIFVCGFTLSPDFPIYEAYDDTLNGSSDAFVSKFSFDGALLWSTFLGGSVSESAEGIAVADDGSCFVTGSTSSDDFPVLHAFNATKGMHDDCFVTKIAPNGTLLWSTFLGGNWNDYGQSVAVASDGSCYITGETYSTNFPLLHAFDTDPGAGEVFVTKFASNGSLLWSSYLGGFNLDIGKNIAVAADDSCLITGVTASWDFPITDINNPTVNADDAFITRLSPSGSLLWSTVLGGTNDEIGYNLAITGNNYFYVTGLTYSTDFPVKNGYSTAFNGGEIDAFVTKYSLSGTLIWSTFLGGSDADLGLRLAVASDNSCFVTGVTKSTDFPVLNAYDDYLNVSDTDIFISQFTSGGSLYWSSYFGGNNVDEVYGIAIAPDDSFVITGLTYSADFPTLNAYDDTFNNLIDAIITRFNVDTLPPIQSQGLSSFGFLSFFFLPIISPFFRKKKQKSI